MGSLFLADEGKVCAEVDAAVRADSPPRSPVDPEDSARPIAELRLEPRDWLPPASP